MAKVMAVSMTVTVTATYSWQVQVPDRLAGAPGGNMANCVHLLSAAR